MNPLIPTGAELTITILGIVHIVLWIAALYKVGTDKYLSIKQKWILLIISTFIPVIGPLGSLIVVGKKAKAAR